MWYVVQVYTGDEEKLKTMCRKQISKEVLDVCFIPYYEEMKKYLGEWHKETKVLFPGYIFIDTTRPEDLFFGLKKVRAFTKLLGDRTDLIPLTESETAFMKKLGGEDQVVGISQGIIENDKVQIIDGPLKGLEGYIRRISRHRRKAEIEVEMFGGRLVRAEVGLEIVRKG